MTTYEKGAVIGMQQINQCIESNPAFKNKLCVLAADSAYSTPECLSESFKNPNQVHIARLRSNRVFYFPEEQKSTAKIGRKKCYGAQFKLNDKTTQKNASSGDYKEKNSTAGCNSDVKINNIF